MTTDLYTMNSKSTIPDKNIITREKFGTQAKKILSFFRENRTKIHKVDYVVAEVIKILKDFKKAVDIICIYEAMGLLTRISPNNYIYTGFKGVSTRLIDYECGKIEGNYVPSYDEILYQGKTVSIRSSLVLGNFVALVFFEVIYFGKSTTKGRIETVIEDFSNRHKDINTKNLSQDVQNIFVALSFIQKNQTTEIITYIGPQFKILDQKKRRDIKKTSQLLTKEDLFFSLPETQKPKQQLNKTQSKIKAKNIQYFHPMNFAILKGKNWQYPLQSLTTIIGRSGYSNNWEVDLDLPYRGVSRQHAVILFNFQAKKWQIRCLSKKNLIKIDGQRFAFRDQDIYLKDRSIIEIGPQTFMFCLAESRE